MHYELINAVTTNSVAAFESEDEAQAALSEFRASDAAFAKTLTVVAFDDNGHAHDEEVAEPSASARVRANVSGGFGRRAATAQRATARRRSH
jgi:hypothetical protein